MLHLMRRLQNSMQICYNKAVFIILINMCMERGFCMEEKQKKRGSLKTYILILALLPVFILGTEAVALLFIYLKGKVDDTLFNAVLVQVLIFMAGTLIIASGVVIILVRRMIATLLRLSDTLTALSEGDLTREIEEKDLSHHNELGSIAYSTQQLNEKLKELVSQISGTARILKDSADDMNQVAESTTQAADHVTANMQEITAELTGQSQQTENVSTDVVQIGRMIEQSTDALNNLREDMDAIRISGTEGVNTVEELENVDEDVRSRMDVIAQQTNTTNSSAQQIRSATELIASIAEETNLLALNASIEAARAGEQGRGFAVVADQIQKLAEQSNQSAAAIDKVVQNLLVDAGNAVATMDEIQRSIQKQNETVAAVKDVFMKVNEGIIHSVKEIDALADSTVYLNDSKTRLVGASENLSAISQNSLAITEETTAEAQELDSSVSLINESAANLQQCAEELKQEIGYFRYLDE